MKPKNRIFKIYRTGKNWKNISIKSNFQRVFKNEVAKISAETKCEKTGDLVKNTSENETKTTSDLRPLAWIVLTVR